MIPLWKIRREWARFGQQLRTIPEALWEPAAQRRHEAAFDAGFPVAEGSVSLGEKVAIVLCWQPKGVAQSLVDMCAHLAGAGYAPLLVANAPLGEEGRARLAPVVWQMLERPNFGYDFGGYRDGIRFLQARGVTPSRLVILNDSIWYPLWPGDDTLLRMEDSAADIVGTVLRRRGGELFLESYFYSIAGRVFAHAAFGDFWRDLRLTSNKYKVIRRGERGFSRAMREAGLRLEGLFTEDGFRTAIAAADEQLLRETLTFSAFVDPSLRAEAGRLSSGASGGQMRDFILGSLEKAQFYSAFPVAACRLMRYPVMKKSREPVGAFWRAAWLRAVEAGAIAPPFATIQKEATAMEQGR